MQKKLHFADIQRVLVVKPSSLGDIIHTLPAVEALAKKWPHWQIDWVANTEWLPVIEGHPALHATISFPRKQLRGAAAPKNFFAWAKQLREGGDYQLCLDFQGLFRSAAIAVSCGAKQRLGLSDAREGARFCYQQAAQVAVSQHAVERYLQLARLCGAEEEANREKQRLPWLPQGVKPQLREEEELGQEYVVFHPFSRGDGKALTVSQMHVFLQAMSPRQVVLVGRATEQEIPAKLPSHVINLVNRTSLAELCWILRGAKATVSVDSGPMHLAAALPAPVLSLHAWSNPHLVGPWGENGYVWKAGSLLRRSELDKELAQQKTVLDDKAVEVAANWALDH